jgi:murein DD-endopeptidase MepM/ murein hydrolase activator NlpD
MPSRRLLAGLLLIAAPGHSPPELKITHRARALHPGEVVVLDIVSDAPLTTLETRAFGRIERVRALPATPEAAHAWQVILGIDLDVKPGRHPVTVAASSPGGPTSVVYPLDVTAKAFPTRRLTVAPGFVNPPASEVPRIEAEAAELAELWKGASGPDLTSTLAFVAPVPQPANSAFGTRSIFNGEPRSPHGGADFPSPAGTPVIAPAAGKVVLARDLYYTGGTVVIDHGLGIVSLFAHLSRIDAHAGDEITRGDTVGLVGATGRVTGPHLHWTLRVNGARVDPLSMLAVLGPS